MSTIRRFLEPLMYHKKATALAVFVFSLRHIHDMFAIFAVKKTIDYITTSDYRGFLILISIYAVYGIVHQVLNYRLCVNFLWIEYDIKKRIYQKYIPRLIRLDNNTYEGIWTGKMVSYFKEGIDKRTDLLVGGVSRWVKVIVSGTFSVYIILSLWFWYFCVFIVLSLTFNYLAIKIKNLGMKRRAKRYEAEADFSRSVVRVIMSKNTILETNSEKSEVVTVVDKISIINKFRKELRKTEHIGVNMSVILPFVLNVVFLYIGGTFVFEKQLTLWEFVWISTLLTYLSALMRDMGMWFEDILKNSISVTKLRSLMDDTPQIIWYDSGKEFVYTRGDITLEQISYWYHKEILVFDHFSLRLEWGKKTALVGMSGSWKSTLIKLIAWYLHPLSWRVLIDWQALPREGASDHISLISFYQHIGYLTQEPSVFDGTVYENLVYSAKSRPTETELMSALMAAKCEFVFDLPQGVETQIGEKGVKLSWGQRQRLAIAKIFLKNPQIILLDEPTSALDSFSEEEVSQAFDNLFAGRTVIVIAHRLQTVKKADRILVLDQGVVKEDGTHNELVGKWGIYSKMLELQSGF